MHSILETHLSPPSLDAADKVPSNISKSIAYLLQHSSIQQTIHEVTTQPRYQELSIAEQTCVQCFFHAKKDEATTNIRAARNHHRADIGAWLLMHHLPVHPLLTTITDTSQPRLQELLPNEDDRTMFERCGRIHTLIHHHDLEGYLSFIQRLPAEEQSVTIQTYKQLIIGRMSHTNGHSIYFPYLPAEKSNIPYDLTSLYDPELLEQFPRYQEQLDLLRSSPEHISPPRTAAQELFHDLIFISSTAYQLKNPEILAELHKIRSDSRVGFVAPRVYPRELFVSLSERGTLSPDQAPTEVAKQSEDPYLLHSYTTLSSMRGCTKTLLQDRATLHEAYQEHGCYPLEKLETLKNIRRTIELLSELHGRIDVHYFVSSANNENSNSSNLIIKDIGNDWLILSSGQKKSIIDLMSHVKTNGSHDGIYITSSLDKYEIDYLLSINHFTEFNIFSEPKLYQLIEFIQLTPNTIVLFSNNDVLYRICKKHKLKETEGSQKTYILPIYRGSYQEDGVCSSPKEWIKTIEQLRLLVHEYTANHSIYLKRYRATLHQDALQSFSTNDFCYRIVDCLRKIAHQDKDLSTDLYKQLVEASCSTKTIHRFLEEHHKLIHPTPMDEHTE